MICSQNLETMATAAVVAYYNPQNEIRISYAGHPPVLFKRAADKAWSYIRSPKRPKETFGSPLNIPLFLDGDTDYTQQALSMGPGDRLFVYTDGIIEARNPDGKIFGFERLKEILDANQETPLKALKKRVLDELNKFITKEPAQDDITLIAMEII